MPKGSTKGSGFQISGMVLGVLAIVAGVLVLWGALPIHIVVGIFLIIFGIVAISGK